MLRPFCENRGEAKRESIRRLVDGRDGDGADDEAGGRDGDDELMVWLWWEAEAWLLELLAKGAAHSRRWLGLMDEYGYLGRQRPPNNARLLSACAARTCPNPHQGIELRRFRCTATARFCSTSALVAIVLCLLSCSLFSSIHSP